MLEKIKISWKVLTVKIGVGAVVISLLSLFMPWFTYNNMSQSVVQAIKADPDFFAGVSPIFAVSMLWVVGFFLTNHPKLTLVGDAALLFLYAGFAIAGSDRGLSAGVGSYLYLLMVFVCIVCAFLTKKRKKTE